VRASGEDESEQDGRESHDAGYHDRPSVENLRYGRAPKYGTRVRRSLAVLVALGLAFASATASAVPVGRAPVTRRVSRSIGLPFEGRLESGVLVRETPLLRYTPEYAPNGNFFATAELAALLHRVSAHVARRRPGARLSIGEISRAHGGPIPGHNSHQNGRDVDIAFYMLDGRRQPFMPWAFANFDDQGRGDGPNVGLRFDDVRNWELVARLVSDADVRVQFVFVANGLKQRLLAEARRVQASPSVIARAERVLVQPAEGHPHRNHFHVRVYCSRRSGSGCRDRAPFHPWAPRR